MKSKTITVIVWSIGLAFVFSMLFLILTQRSECVDHGGTFVKGLFWFECVNG